MHHYDNRITGQRLIAGCVFTGQRKLDRYSLEKHETITPQQLFKDSSNVTLNMIYATCFCDTNYHTFRNALKRHA